MLRGMAGVQIRTSHASGWTQCRQRGAATAKHSLVMLDIASADALTSAFDGYAAKNNIGSSSTASSPLSTVLPATANLTHGRVGVVVDRAAADNQLGLYELGERGDGGVVPVAVQAMVLVDAASVPGAALCVSDSDGVAVFAAGVAGGAFATLLDDGTADDGKGPTAAVNVRWVILYSEGLPAAPNVSGVVPADSISNTELRNSAAVSVIGRSAATAGDPADIVATEGLVLRMATTLGFGQVTTAGIAANAVTGVELRDSTALSVIGRSNNVTSNPEDLVAANDAEVLRRSGTALGFGTIATAGITDGAVTVAKTAVLAFNAQTGTTFTPAITDLDNVVTLSNAAAITVTLPQDSDVAYPVGRSFVAMWLGAGQPTFAAGTGATVRASGGLLAIAAQYDMVSALKISANTWALAGPRA